MNDRTLKPETTHDNNAALVQHEQEVALREIRSELRDRQLDRLEEISRRSHGQERHEVYDQLESEEEPVAPKRKRESDYGMER